VIGDDQYAFAGGIIIIHAVNFDPKQQFKNQFYRKAQKLFQHFNPPSIILANY
jgi:hypothetical protein